MMQPTHPLDIPTTVATRLGALVAFKRVSLDDLGVAIGSNAKRARKILAGEAEPTLCETVLAARFLGIKTSVIVGEIRFDDPASAA